MNLSRYTQKIFGLSALGSGQNAIGEFGSKAAGSPVRYAGSAANPSLTQNLSAWLTGWTAAILSGNSPTIQDRNSVDYTLSYQLAYILQKGLPEWDSGTTYYTGNFVQSAGIIYQSAVDNNTNEAVSNPNFWTRYFDFNALVFNQQVMVRDWVCRTQWAANTNNAWNKVAFSESLSLAAAVSSDSATDGIMTSSDANIWTAVASPTVGVFNDIWRDDTAGYYVIVGNGGLIIASTDGITWTTRTSGTTQNLSGVRYCKFASLWIACSSTGGTQAIFTSPDTVTWTAQTTPNVALQGLTVAEALGQIVAVGTNLSILSTNATTWTAGAVVPNGHWKAASFASAFYKYAAVSNNSSDTYGVMVSTDGSNWAGVSVVANLWEDIKYDDGSRMWCACSGNTFGTTNQNILTSIDGSNFVTHEVPVANQWNGLCPAKKLGMWICVGSKVPGLSVMTSNPSPQRAPPPQSCRYDGATVSGTITGTPQVVNFTNQEYDSNFSTTQGPSINGLWTVQSAGKYSVKAQVALTWTPAAKYQTVSIFIERNSTVISNKTFYTQDSGTGFVVFLDIDDEVLCANGDQIGIYVSVNGATPTLNSVTGGNHLAIAKTGS